MDRLKSVFNYFKKRNISCKIRRMNDETAKTTIEIDEKVPMKQNVVTVKKIASIKYSDNTSSNNDIDSDEIKNINTELDKLDESLIIPCTDLSTTENSNEIETGKDNYENMAKEGLNTELPNVDDSIVKYIHKNNSNSNMEMQNSSQLTDEPENHQTMSKLGDSTVKNDNPAFIETSIDAVNSSLLDKIDLNKNIGKEQEILPVMPDFQSIGQSLPEIDMNSVDSEEPNCLSKEDNLTDTNSKPVELLMGHKIEESCLNELEIDLPNNANTIDPNLHDDKTQLTPLINVELPKTNEIETISYNKSSLVHENFDIETELELHEINKDNNGINGVNYNNNSIKSTEKSYENEFKNFIGSSSSQSTVPMKITPNKTPIQKSIEPTNASNENNCNTQNIKSNNRTPIDTISISSEESHKAVISLNLSISDVEVIDTSQNDTEHEDYDSDCSGYHSSDFEFITEEEAKSGGLISNAKIPKNVPKTRIISVTPDFETGPSRNIEYKLFDYAKYYAQDPRNHRIPEGEEYVNLFQIYPQISTSYFMEHKSTRPTKRMNIEYEGVGFEMQIMKARNERVSNRESQKEAEDTIKKIMQMYPGENKRKRRY